VGTNPDIKNLETLIMYNVCSNLNQSNNDDLEPYLEAFLSQNGLNELAPLLRVDYEGIVKQAIIPLPTIFMFYSAHDILKDNPSIVMDVYAKIEDESSAAIKVLAFNSLNSLLSTMRAGSFNMIQKVALRYAR